MFSSWIHSASVRPVPEGKEHSVSWLPRQGGMHAPVGVGRSGGREGACKGYRASWLFLQAPGNRGASVQHDLERLHPWDKLHPNFQQCWLRAASGTPGGQKKEFS